MPDEYLKSDEQSRKNTRRKILSVAVGAGTSTLTFSGSVTADKGSKEITGRGPQQDITTRDPEDIFDENITQMSDEELDELLEEKWDEGMGQKEPRYGGDIIRTAAPDKNCVSDTLDTGNIPLIDVDVCLVDEPCGIEVTVGALGQSLKKEFNGCDTVCNTIRIDAVAEVLEFELCHHPTYSDLDIHIERCNWRPTRGWDCPTNRDWSLDLPL